MIRSFLWVLSCMTILTFLVACSNEKVVSPKNTGGNDSQEIIKALDYTQLESVISEVLMDMPDFSIEREISEQELEKDVSLSISDSEKRLFRLKTESLLIGNTYDNQELQVMAEKSIENNLKALTVAKEKYGVTITQEEVTNYIFDHVSDNQPPEKKQYADSLGITIEELDTFFDRDLYIMDTLWIKLTPVMMEKNRQKDGESSEDYMDRLKRELSSE